MIKWYRAYRNTAREMARAVLANKDLVVLDFESTGLNTAVAGIVQVSIIDITGKPLVSAIINPEKAISAGAAKAHGLTEADIIGKPTFPDIYKLVYASLAGNSWLTYNSVFDTRLLASTCEWYGLELPQPRVIYDALPIASFYAGNFDTMQNSFRYPKLSSLQQLSKIDIDLAHDALYDCRMTLAFIKKLASEENDG